MTSKASRSRWRTVSHHDPSITDAFIYAHAVVPEPARDDSGDELKEALAKHLLGKLTDTQRPVVELVIMNGLTITAAAELLGIGFDVARKRLSRARSLLKREAARLNE